MEYLSPLEFVYLLVAIQTKWHSLIRQFCLIYIIYLASWFFSFDNYKLETVTWCKKNPSPLQLSLPAATLPPSSFLLYLATDSLCSLSLFSRSLWSQSWSDLGHVAPPWLPTHPWAPSTTTPSFTSTPPSIFVRVFLVFTGVSGLVKTPVPFLFWKQVLDLLVSGETFTGHGCSTGNGFGDSVHLELFSSTPTWE